MELLKVDNIAEMIGKQRQIINIRGKEVESLVWKPSELVSVYNSLSKIAEKGGNFIIDGAAPQWLIVNIVHALHPNRVALNDPKVGVVSIVGLNKPAGKGSGPLPFTVTTFNGGTLVEYAKEGSVIVDIAELNDIVPPAVCGGPVFMSGRTATWAVAEIAMSYAHVVPAVYLYQPGTGFVCVITHNVNHELGMVIE